MHPLIEAPLINTALFHSRADRLERPRVIEPTAGIGHFVSSPQRLR
jgi:hypothetical protein